MKDAETADGGRPAQAAEDAQEGRTSREGRRPQKATPREDRRVVRTREALFAAFERLLSDREYDEITVSALAREADVNRKTFYLHYGSIDDLLFDKFSRLAERLAETVEERLKERADDPPRDPIDFCVATLFVEFDRWVKGREDINRRELLALPGERLLGCLKAPFVRVVDRAGLMPQGVPDWVIDAHIAFVVGGTLGIYVTWLESDRATPPDDLLRAAALFTSGSVHRVRETFAVEEGTKTDEADQECDDAGRKEGEGHGA